MSNVQWIKIYVDMFDSIKFRIIDTLPERDSIIYIWMMLLCTAGKQNDGGYIYFMEDTPFTSELLAIICSRPKDVVERALQVLSEYKMIEIDDEGYIKITNWEKYQNVEGLNKLKEKSPKKSPKKSLVKNKNNCKVIEKKCNVTCNVTPNTCNVTVTQQNKNKKEDKEKKREIREKVCVTQNEKTDSEKQAKSFYFENLDEVAKREAILASKKLFALSDCHDTRSILTPREYGEPLPRSNGC